ncbi:MAG: Nitrogen assimilation regulatory protein [Alphaproteobacteria bacterium MarineAlpha9_Bin3]|nr:MAG: Nitrogen assimilation regulatory protein [Alphaproteobacteria bacterium MarineAlpha9_Bin3]|tara:strand:+ start:48581 stop:50026 length:1446 start_codon:yes stop_codon:yes gene_type:complete
MEKPLILIADDDKAIRLVLEKKFNRSGFSTKTTDNGKTLLSWVEQGDGDLIITDVVMEDSNGLDLLPLIHQIRPDIPVMIMSGLNTIKTAIEASTGGAYEYFAKPFDLDHVLDVVTKSFNSKKNKDNIRKDDGKYIDDDLPIVGSSPSMQEVYKVLAKLVNSDLTVMISGESGTGKELIAKALHDYGSRKEKPFIAINMAAIPRELIESELFGYERGAFTGADKSTKGKFELANEGTLFLDEIGDMPIEAQTRLLRVLQDGCFTAVGGKNTIYTNVRIVAATHRNLSNMINDGLFREDLFYRLNVVPINVPPLRDRSDDIPLLINHFIKKYSDNNNDKKSFDKDALRELKDYNWPGNVRELENLIKRIIILVPQNIIDKGTLNSFMSKFEKNNSNYASASLGASVEKHLNQYFDSHKNELPANGLYDRIVHEVERPLIVKTLNLVRGNQLKAAELLGINRNTLRKKIIYLDIQLGGNVKKN